MDPSVLRRLVLVARRVCGPRSEIADGRAGGDVIKQSFAAENATEYQRIYSERPLQDFAANASRPPRWRCVRATSRTCQPSAIAVGRVKTPTLVVWGKDVIVPVEAVRCTPRRYRGARLQVHVIAGPWRTSSGRMSWRP